MRIALAQLNPVVGAVGVNTRAIITTLAEAQSAGAQLAIFPEQSILGYPSKDVLLRSELVRANVAALHEIATHCRDLAAIVGFAEPNPRDSGRPLFNAAALLSDGVIVGVSRKQLLPNYDVFDEARYFEPAGAQAPLPFRGHRLGVSICEDMWSHDEVLGRRLYAADPLADQTTAGASLLINISASPFWLGKPTERIALLREHARRNQRTILFVNQVGGNDELIFDGGSAVVGADGAILAQARAFEPDMLYFDLPSDHTSAAATSAPIVAARREATLDDLPAVHSALVLGLRDYVRKCGFREVVLGLSGGIDSALVAALAVEALGAGHVLGVAMPSRFSSEHSLTDARALAENLGISFTIIPIESVHAAYESLLRPHFAGRPADVTEENIQARVRGAILMALSNKTGRLLLTTGNKSELAVGYCTLYGDMCGGLAVISDVPKTMVHALAARINAEAAQRSPATPAPIPISTLTKPPSAELRPNQTDQDSLPPYDVLDEIIERYEVRLETAEQIIAAGFSTELVNRVIRLLHTSEYKRQQAAPGLKVTSRAFGFGRRMPIAARLG